MKRWKTPQFCGPCPTPLELESLDSLSFFGRGVAQPDSPFKAWELAATVVERNTAEMSHLHLVAAENAVVGLIVAQIAKEDNDRPQRAKKLLAHMSQVAHTTVKDDPYPDCAESELLLALCEDEEGLWGLPGIVIVSFVAGEKVSEDVTVFDSEEVPLIHSTNLSYTPV